MNDYLNWAVVSYENEKQRKQLEDYLSLGSGHKVDLRKIKGDEKENIFMISLDLKEIKKTDRISTFYASNKYSGEQIEDFIRWHSRVSDMHLAKALEKAIHPADLIALHYNEESDEISYICFRMLDRQDIEKYLVSTDGIPEPVQIKGARYWLLESDVNRNKILFTRSDDYDDPNSFENISPYQWDLDLFKYLITL